MENLRMLTSSDLDPEYRDIAENIANSLIYSAERALISIDDPVKASLPAAQDSFECLSLAYMKTFGRTAFDAGKANVLNNDIRNDLPHNRLFDAVDLKSALSIMDQLFPSDQKESLRTLTLKTDLLNKGKSNLLFRINGMYCVEETNSITNDYIKMQAVVTDGMGNSYKSGQLDLERDWDSGESNNWKADGEPKPLVNFNLDFGRGWPRTYTAVISMSEGYESDGMQKLADLMEKVLDKVEEKLVAYLKNKFGPIAAAQIGALIGVAGGLLGMLIGAAVGFVVGAVIAYVIDKVFGWFKGAFIETKIFTPLPFAFTIPYSGYKLENEYFQNLTWTDYNAKFIVPVEAKLEWGNANSELTALTHENKRTQSIFKVSNDNKILCNWYGNKIWMDTHGMASVDSIVSVVINSGQHECYLFVIGQDNRVWYSLSTTILEKDNANKYPRFAEFTEWLPIFDQEFIQGMKLGAVSRDAGKIDLFATAADGCVWTAAIGTQTSNQWAGWWPIGDSISLPGAAVAAISRSMGILDLFVAGLDGKVKSNSYIPGTDDSWNGWFDILDFDQFIPGVEITAISRAENLIDLFGIAVDGYAYTASWNPDQGWAGWTRIGDLQFTKGSTIAVAAYSPENLDIFSIAPDGLVWTAAKGAQTAQQWEGWWPVGDWLFEEGANLTALTSDNHLLQVYVIGLDGKNCFARYSDNTWEWFAID
ncbi:MAG: hypothetical protein K0R59_151 [Sphingobacterium sp.]|jgi:hypothetical protein|nr:hypothetical protein [Sphingobacterium sp.]